MVVAVVVAVTVVAVVVLDVDVTDDDEVAVGETVAVVLPPGNDVDAELVAVVRWVVVVVRWVVVVLCSPHGGHVPSISSPKK